MRPYQSEWDNQWLQNGRPVDSVSVQDAELFGLDISAEQRIGKLYLKNCSWNQIKLSSDRLEKKVFTELTNCSVNQAQWVDLDLRLWRWEQSTWRFVDVRNSRLDRVTFDGVHWVGCALAYAVLRDCVFRRCVGLQSSDLSHTVFERCVFVEMDFNGWNVDSTALSTVFRACIFVNCKGPSWFESLCRSEGQVWLNDQDEAPIAPMSPISATAQPAQLPVSKIEIPKLHPSRFGSLERIGDAG